MSDMTLDQRQSYWDALLIRTFRQFQTVGDLRAAFKATVGEDGYDDLLRVCQPWVKGTTQVRLFVAASMPTLNGWLLERSPKKDVALHRYLQTSSYTTKASQFGKDMLGVRSICKDIREAESVILLSFTRFQERNHSTEWGVHQ